MIFTLYFAFLNKFEIVLCCIDSIGRACANLMIPDLLPNLWQRPSAGKHACRPSDIEVDRLHMIF